MAERNSSAVWVSVQTFGCPSFSSKAVWHRTWLKPRVESSQHITVLLSLLSFNVLFDTDSSARAFFRNHVKSAYVSAWWELNKKFSNVDIDINMHTGRWGWICLYMIFGCVTEPTAIHRNKPIHCINTAVFCRSLCLHKHSMMIDNSHFLTLTFAKRQ